jgi:hypothetical protein
VSQHCGKCGDQLGFFSSKHQDWADDGTEVLLCKSCWLGVVDAAREAVEPHELSNGCTRITATVWIADWSVPVVCVGCGSTRGVMPKKTLEVPNGAYQMSQPITVTTPLYLCRRCAAIPLDPSRYIRYALDSNNLTLEVGNPVVAEVYVAFLAAHLASTQKALLGLDGPVSTRIGNLPAGIFHDSARRLGVKDVSRIPAA